MENLLEATLYSPDIVTRIESTGATGISIANRWMLGWPERVRALLTAGVYMEHLESQLDQEKEVLANEANLRHLSPREILALYEIRQSPPSLGAHADHS